VVDRVDEVADGALRVAVLGPIRAVDATGRDVTPDGPRQRRLLALLVLRRGQAVSADAAIDALWPDQPPQDPSAALHTQVFRLRRRLPDGLIESLDDGYRLAADRVTLDADALRRALSEESSAAEPGALADLLRRWHGPAYPELADVDAGRQEAQRLEELRVRAREAVAERRLALGGADEAITELVALVDDEPLRERPRELLMRALAATGRRAEALRVFDDLRRRLGEELGIEPSPGLAAQHAELLEGTGVQGWSARTRLPSPATTFVGRTEAVADVAAMVTGHRAVTLVGPAGVGKSRLAVEAGHLLLGEDPDRPVVHCDLGSSGPADGADAVAAALGIDARPGVDPVDRVPGVVGDTELVLVLDGCEHVLDAIAPLVEGLVTRCPQAHVLATSRERLRVQGEQVCPVVPLPTDAAGQLFVERAQAVQPGFRPAGRDAQVVAEVVRRLDGLPLAIELAAARLHTHELDEVAEGLDERFSLLSDGPRTSTRHASLGAAVAWSYALLDEPLRATFAALSSFVGSFTVADAAVVADQAPRATRDALARLTEQSLVQREPGHRFVLLETLRAYGASVLAERGEADAVAGRHARHQAAWAEDADRRLLTGGPGVTSEIDAAIPELRSGLAWLLDRGDLDAAARLVGALRDYGFFRLRPDVLGWCEQVIAVDPGREGPLAAQVWHGATYAAWMTGDRETTQAHAARARRATGLADTELPPEVATISGSMALFDGDLAEAVRWYRQAIAACDDDPAQRLFASATEVLALAYADDPDADARGLAVVEAVEALGAADTPYAAYAWYAAGEALLHRAPDEARTRLTRAIQLGELTGASLVTGVAGASRASIDARSGDPEAAAEEYRRLIGHWRAAGMWATQWTMLRSIAQLLARLERWHDAAVLEGAVRATQEGARIYGADEEALAQLSERLRSALGDRAYADAVRAGSVLDGDAAAEHALRAL
jgi:predicted ATPase/DNA-binding SARP family transcriptional activator